MERKEQEKKDKELKKKTAREKKKKESENKESKNNNGEKEDGGSDKLKNKKKVTRQKRMKEGSEDDNSDEEQEDECLAYDKNDENEDEVDEDDDDSEDSNSDNEEELSPEQCWIAINPPVLENEIVGKWFGCIFNSRKCSNLFVGRALNRFLYDEGGYTVALRLDCLQLKFGVTDCIFKEHNQSQQDIETFPIADIADLRSSQSEISWWWEVGNPTIPRSENNI